MTVISQRTTHRYVGDGIQNSWPILFKFLEPEHVKALKTSVEGVTTPLVYGSEYTVAALEGGGQCSVQLEDGEQITLFLDVPLTQETDLRDAGRLAPEVLERMADKLTLALQQQKEDIGRCVKVPPESVENPDDYVRHVFDVEKQAQQLKDAAEAAATGALAYKEQSEEQVGLAAVEVAKATSIVSEATSIFSEVQELVDHVRELINNIPNGESSSTVLLSGMVIPFKGTINDDGYPVDRISGIENRNYALCDGRTHSAPDGAGIVTPDLRNRFITGAGEGYMQGDTGGADLVALTVDQMPSHTHSIRAVDSAGEFTFNDISVAARMQTSERTVGETGGSQAHENRPPYYALAYLMKL